MKTRSPPAAPALVSISREGGLAFFPGLARARQIDLSSCDAAARERILGVLGAAAAHAVSQAGSGDQRYFRIEIRSGATARTLLVPEQDAADELLGLWEEAV